MPKPKGECKLITDLVSMTANHVHLWSGLELQGVPEIDLVIWDETVGVFVVEVKAFGIDYINEVGPHEWKLNNFRRRDKPPHLQAQRQRFELSDFLTSRDRNPPWMAATAALPQITREEWTQRVPSRHYGKQWADSVLFREDLRAATQRSKAGWNTSGRTRRAERAPIGPSNMTQNNSVDLMSQSTRRLFA